MDSPRIAFHFLPGNMPLSNGISGIPDLDDTLFGPMSYDPFSVDGPVDDATPEMPRDARPSYSWNQSESVESIFGDLHELCSRRAPSHPLVLPERPFYPFDPAEVADTPDVTMSEGLHTQAAASQPCGASLEVEDSDDSSSEDSDSDSDDDMVGPNAYCDRVDGILPPSPGLSQSSPVSPSRYITRASSSASPFSSPRAPAATPSRRSTKRRAPVKRSKGRRGTKRQTDNITSLSRPLAALSIADASDPNLPPPLGSENVPRAYWYLLRLGCVLSGSGMQCYKCDHISGNIPDMTRHVVVHNRAESEVKCAGCPQSFARADPLNRHVNARGGKGSHCTASRRAFLKTFEKRQEVLDERAKCDYSSAWAVKTMNKTLSFEFEILYKKHKSANNKNKA